MRGHGVTGLGHTVFLREQHPGMRPGTRGGFRGAASWNETFRITLGDSGLGHAV